MKKLSALLFIGGIGSLCYYLGTLSVGIPFGQFFILLGLVLIITGCICLVPKDNKYIKRFKYPIRIFKVLAALFIVSFIIVEGLIIYNGAVKENKTASFVVILGAQVRGETPSNSLYQRLVVGLKYLKGHPGTKVILSGGKGPGEKISEAEAMKRFLVDKGIDESRIIEEDKSSNTLENLENTKKIIDKINKGNNTEDYSIILITNDFHMLRAKLIAERVGLKAYGDPAPILYWLIPASYTREYFAIFKSLVFDRP